MNLRVALCAAFVALTLAACGSSAAPRAPGTGSSSTSGTVADTDVPATGAASIACGDKITPHPAAAQKLPSGFPTVGGWAATEAVSQGKMLVLRGAVRGDPRDIVHVRDTAVGKLTAAGYLRTGRDEEPGFEADADFNGPHPGNINVRALCRDYLVVTYTFDQ